MKYRHQDLKELYILYDCLFSHAVPLVTRQIRQINTFLDYLRRENLHRGVLMGGFGSGPTEVSANFFPTHQLGKSPTSRAQ